MLSKGQYQQVLEQLERLEKQGELVKLSLLKQVECSYYKSRALGELLKYEEA